MLVSSRADCRGLLSLVAMSGEHVHPAVTRIVREHDGRELLDALSSELSTSDLTALMLEVMHRRTANLTAARVLDQYERDRFVRPAGVDPRRLLALELLALDTLVPPFVPIATSPLVPLGTHSVVAGVHQNRIVTTTRGSEVAADPTNTLALEAAVRRRALLREDARSNVVVDLVAVDRVVRAQQFKGPRSSAHFSLLGLASAGRDTGNHTFEATSMQHQIQACIAVCHANGHRHLDVRISDFSGQHQELIGALIEAMHTDAVRITSWPERTAARGYYPSLCFKLCVLDNNEEVEIGDGGLVDWTRALVGSNKERLMISGLSLERLAALTPTQ